jgi:hypothetical protein
MSGPIQQWLQQFGDPTVAAWACVWGYFAAAVLCLRVWLRRGEGGRRRNFFWTSTIVVLVVLGLNKQLDFQTLVIAELRQSFGGSEAWTNRHTLATVIVAVMSIFVIGGFGSVLYDLRSAVVPLQLILVATVLLIGLAMVRAIPGLVDELLLVHVAGPDTGVFHTHLKEVVELALIATISVSAGRLYYL